MHQPGGPRPRLEVKMAVDLPEGLTFPEALPTFNHFFAVLPLRTTREGQYSVSLKSIACLISFPASFLPIFLFFLLMRDNVHPNLGFIFHCSVRAGNVT